MKHVNKLLLFILLSLSIEGFSQTTNWNDFGTPKSFKVIIPDSVKLNLPTNDTYKIGFFISYSDPEDLRTVGFANYVPGTDTEINLSYDPAGLSGYANGERLISFIQNTSTLDVYGVEFKYDNGKNTFKSGEITIVNGIVSNTWTDPLNGKFLFCRFEKEFEIKVPYGTKSHLLYSAGCKVDSSGLNQIVLLNSMTISSTYSFEFFHTEVKFTYVLNGFALKEFPVQYLYSSYEICPGDTISMPSTYEGGDLFRSKNQYNTYNLTKEGTYFFPLFYYPSGCSAMDSVKVRMKDFPLDKINTTHFICPGDIVEVPVVDNENKLAREIISAPDFKLITPGQYIFKASHLTNGCVLNDTITLETNKVNCQTVSYPELIDPVNGNGLVLPLNEKVIVCNSAMQKVAELKAPAIWYGKDNAGTLLPVGVYYIVHENGSSNSVSIIY